MPQVQPQLCLIPEVERRICGELPRCPQVLDAAISGDGFLVELTQTES